MKVINMTCLTGFDLGRIELLLQSKQLLPIHPQTNCCEHVRHTAATQIAFMLFIRPTVNCSRPIKVELGRWRASLPSEIFQLLLYSSATGNEP